METSKIRPISKYTDPPSIDPAFLRMLFSILIFKNYVNKFWVLPDTKRANVSSILAFLDIFRLFLIRAAGFEFNTDESFGNI